MTFKPGETPKGAKPFKKGQSGNPAGRPKKLLSALKEQGYTQSQVNDTLQILFALGEDELKDVEAGKRDYTMLERTIAAALLNGFRKKSLYNIMSILERTYGKPKESTDVTLTGKVNVTLNLNK